MKQIIFSHGFGVQRDDRGLFTDIAAAFPEYQAHMFDYNIVYNNGDMTVRPLVEQAEILEAELAKIGDDVRLVAHSQGCIVAALADISKVQSVIFLAPPDAISVSQMTKVFGTRAKGGLKFNGTTEITRRDGSTTYVPKEYWDKLDNIDVLGLFENLSRLHNLTIIRATEDEILPGTNFDRLDHASVINLATNHDFADRGKLIEIFRALL